MKKILVIEENSRTDNSETAAALAGAGYKTYTSAGDKDGVEIAVNYQPDLIVCNMIDNNEGLKVLRRLCSDNSTSTIPLIFVSNVNSLKAMRKAMEMGADDYFIRPLDLNSLVISVKKLFSKRELLKEKMILQLSSSFGDEITSPRTNDHILVKIGTKLKFVKYSCIVYISALKEYSRITTNENCAIVVRKSLCDWIDILPAQSFLRIHRSTIVNIDYIDKIVKTNTRSYEVYLENVTEPFQISQRFANAMRKTFPS